MKNSFKFSTDKLDLTKAETKDYFEIEGLASTDSPDLESEIVKQNFDLSAIKAGKGYINDDHGHDYEVKDHARLGVIDEAEIRPEGLWIKGKIWKAHPASVAYYNELKHKPGMVQFSVEGYTLKRNPFNDSIVEKAAAIGVALTRNPINRDTYARLAKSLTTVESMESVVDPLFKSWQVSKSEGKIEVTTIVDPEHPDYNDFMSYFTLVKGGAGSGRRGGMGHSPTLPQESAAQAAVSAQQEVRHEKEVVVRPKEEVEKEKQEEQIKKESDQPEEMEDATAKTSKDQRQSKELQRKEALKQQLKDAREIARTPEEARKNVAEVKQKQLAGRKTRVRKSIIQAELIRRAQNSPQFKKSLDEIISKALASGGPAYATTLPGDMEGGQVFQQESLNAHARKKRCKKCKDKGPECKCK